MPHLPTSITKLTKQTALQLVILAVALFGTARAGEVFNGAPAKGFFSTPDHATVTSEYTEIQKTIRNGDREKDFYLLAIPSREGLSFEITALKLREILSGETTDVFADLKEEERADALRLARERVTLKEFGRFRGLQTARLIVDRGRLIYRIQKNFEIVDYNIRVSYATTNARVAVDSALADGPYRHYLNAAITIPQAIDSFAHASDVASYFPADVVSIQPRQGWWRIPIQHDDVYTIDLKYLAELGVDVATIKMSDLLIVRNGVAVPVIRSGDGPMAKITFVAKRANSSESDNSAYFLSTDGAINSSPSLKTENAPQESAALQTTFRKKYRSEKDEIFQTQMGAFLSVQKMLWVWKEIKPTESVSFEIDAPGLAVASSTENTTATIHLFSAHDTLARKYSLHFYLNDKEVNARDITSTKDPLVLSLPLKQLRESANKLEIRDTSTAVGNGSPLFVDAVDLEYESTFAGKNGVLDFEFDEDAMSHSARLRLTGFRGQDILALDLSGAEPVRLPVTSQRGTALIDVQIHPGARFHVQEEEIVTRPPPAVAVAENPVAGDGNADILIIYNAKFAEAAKALASDFSSTDATIETVDVERLYDAYNFGDVSSEAIRDYLSDAVNCWSGKRPYAAILIGDANADGENISRQNVPNDMPIHSIAAGIVGMKNRISSDAYYSWLNPGDELADIIVSRISPPDAAAAMNTVRNIATYRRDQETPQDWKQHVLLISDTGGFDTSARTMSKEFGLRETSTQLSVDEMPWEDNFYIPPNLITREEDSKVSPIMTAAIEDAYLKGVGLSLFFGHGAPNLWSNQRFWFAGGTPNSDVLRMQRNEKLTFVTSFTCNNAVIDYPLRPWNICIAEDFMRYEGKGAIGCFMPSGPGYITNHEVLARGFLRAWHDLGIREHGVVAELSRLYHQVTLDPDDHSRMFILLGDPTLKFAPPPMLDAPGNDGGMMIDRIVEIPSTTGNHSRWSVQLKNNSPREVSDELQITVTDGGESSETILKEEKRPVTVSGKAYARELVDAEIPPGTIARIEARFTGAVKSSPESSPSPSSRNSTLYVVSPSDTGTMKLCAPSVVLSGAISPGGGPRLSYVLGNASRSEANGMLHLNGKYGGRTFSLNRKVEKVPMGAVVQCEESLPLTTTLSAPLTIEFVYTATNAEQPEWTQTWTQPLGKLSDLAIDAAGLKFSPSRPSDGGTIFVSAFVENKGTAASLPVPVSLFDATDTSYTMPLRNMARTGVQQIGALQPGERREFQLRWDPKDNAGDRSLVVVVDPGRTNLDTNRANNSQPFSVQVRTRSKLASGPLSVAGPDAGGKYKLTAQVSNLGETDSRPCVVTFYKSQQQNEETRLGEIIVPEILAQQTLAVVFDIPTTMSPTDPLAFAPSFTLASKGSLMRVSSTTHD